MSTNKYFNLTENVSEQELYQSLVTEAIQIHGTDVLYIKRDTPEIDEILREPKYSKYTDTYTIEMYAPDGGVATNHNFSISKFGWLANDTLDLVVSMKVWDIKIAPHDDKLICPREGDLIYVGNSNTMHSTYINTVYEITRVVVGNENRFEFGTNHMYTLSCVVYAPDNDEFDTDIDNIDEFLNDNEHKTEISESLKDEVDNIVVPSFNPFGDL